MTCKRALVSLLSSAVMTLAAACGGGDGGSGGGNDTKKLTSGDFAFEVEFLGAQRSAGEVMRAGQAQPAPSGTEWWAFELRIKNVSDRSMQSANTPDVGVACGDQPATAAETVDAPGFIMGSAPYAAGMIGNGASNTGIVPLAVPSNATNCRLVVRMDPLHDPDSPEIAEFPFQAAR